jgi:hypothetical protein
MLHPILQTSDSAVPVFDGSGHDLAVAGPAGMMSRSGEVFCNSGNRRAKTRKGEAGIVNLRELCTESRFAPSKRTPRFFTAENPKPPSFLAQAPNTPELADYDRFALGW